jgi:hypothetical protein
VEAKVDFSAQIPLVTVLVDRSASMLWTLQGDYESYQTPPDNRWLAVRGVLLGNPAVAGDLGVVGDFQDRVSFGASFYSEFTDTSGCSLLLDNTANALNNHSAIASQYDSLEPYHGTPTAEAYRSVAEQLALASDAGTRKAIILATDGEPSGCNYGGAGGAKSNVEAEVERAYGNGISTFLVFIGPTLDAAGQAHLQNVANLGVGRPVTSATPAPYFTGQDVVALRTAFGSIVSRVQGCVFELNGEVAPDSASLGVVELDGQALEYEGADGWGLASPSQIELLGAACEAVKGASETLDIRFPCGAYTPIVI